MKIRIHRSSGNVFEGLFSIDALVEMFSKLGVNVTFGTRRQKRVA